MALSCVPAAVLSGAGTPQPEGPSHGPAEARWENTVCPLSLCPRCHLALALTLSSSPRQVPDEHFATLLAYLEGLKGRARELTVQKAEALIQELDEAGSEAALQGKAQRLRQVLQLLS